MVREPDATMQSAPQDNQLMSKHRVLSLEPHLRLERRGHGGQDETEKSDHSASLGNFITPSTRTGFSVHTGVKNGSVRARAAGPFYPQKRPFHPERTLKECRVNIRLDLFTLTNCLRQPANRIATSD